MFLREKVRRVDVLVAEQTELRRVSSTVQNCSPLSAEITRYGFLSGAGSGIHHREEEKRKKKFESENLESDKK